MPRGRHAPHAHRCRQIDGASTLARARRRGRLPVRLLGRRDRAGRRRRRLPRCEPDAAHRRPRPRPRRRALPRQPGAHEPRREPAARQRPDRARRPEPHRGHGLRRLLRPRRLPRRHAAPATALSRLRAEPRRRPAGRREHRLGHLVPGDAARDRRRLDGLRRAPREHPRPRLQRHRDRGLRAPARVAGRRPGRRHLHARLRGDRQGRRRPL